MYLCTHMLTTQWKTICLCYHVANSICATSNFIDDLSVVSLRFKIYLYGKVLVLKTNRQTGAQNKYFFVVSEI